MKVRIPAQTVEVDPEAWALSYGVELKEVREDVKEYFGNGYCQQIVDGLDMQPKPENKNR